LRLRPRPAAGLGLRPLRAPIRSASTAASPSAPPAASALAAGLGRVDPSLLEMAKRHDDLGPPRPALQEVDDLAPERGRRISRERRDPFGVEEDHARPGNPRALTCRALEVHHEEVPLVVEGVLAVFELRKRLAAEILEQREVLLAALEGLLHRDHPVSEHSRLSH
jgi:hypothetical protein